MTATLISGPAASGKTARLVGLAASRYREDPVAETLVIVPTARHGDQFRRRLVAEAGSALALRIATFSQLAHDLDPAARVIERSLAAELVARAAAEQVARGGAAYFRPIAGMPGLVTALARAVDELIGEGVTPDELRAAAPEGPLAALAAVYGSVASELDGRGWIHPAEAPRGATRAARRLPGLVLVDSFAFLRAVEVDLLAAVAEHSELVIALDPDAGVRAAHTFEEISARLPGARRERTSGRPPAPTVSSALAADQEDQLRRIAREIKDLLTRDPTLRPSDCAVVFRQVVPQLALAREVFSEYELPLDPAAGEPLARRPFGIFARRLMRLDIEGWRLGDLTALLNSDFVDRRRWGLRRRHVGLLARFGRRNGLWAGRDALSRIATGLSGGGDEGAAPAAERRAAADGLRAALAELEGLVAGPDRRPGERARRLDAALFGRAAIVPPAIRDLPAAEAELDAFRALLRSVEAADDALGLPEEPEASFVERLERRLEAPTVLLREAGGVLLAPMHTLHGLRFAHVAVGDLVEGRFPAPRRSGDLLDEAARELLAARGLALPPRARLSEDALWHSVRSRSEARLSAWRPRLDERGRPAAPSYYLESLDAGPPASAPAPGVEGAASRREIAIAATAAWPAGERRRPAGYEPWPLVRAAARVEQRRRSRESAGPFEGRVAAGRVPWLTGPESVWSATRLESYQLCPFQFFGHYALRLREPQEEREAADAATRGTVVHRILEEVVRPLAEAGLPLSMRTLDEALARLEEVAPRMWREAPERYGFGRAALWRLEGPRVRRQLAILLRGEAEWNDGHGVTRVLGTEMALEGSLGEERPLRLGAHVDRLDEGEGFVSVVDYKSGREITRGDLVRGERLQLQIYAALALRARGASRALARYAYLSPAAGGWHLDSADAADQPLLERVERVALGVREQVEDGLFQVSPQVPVCPSYCAFRHSCRVNQFSRLKRWS